MRLLRIIVNKYLRLRRAILLLVTKKNKINLNESYKYSIDLVYITHSKDAHIFINSLNSAIDKVKHTVNNIIVVYPEKDKYIFNNLLISYNYKAYTDEEILNEYLKRNTVEKINNQKKSPNWLKQQILKYLISYKVLSENYLVIDSDTIFVDDIIFLENGLPIFYFSDELHLRYKKYIYTLFNKYNFSTKSYIAHMMLFNKGNINTLLSILTESLQEDKVNAGISRLIDIHDFENNCVISEYELYSFYYRNILCQKYQSRYWRNISLKDFNINLVKYSDNFYSISFHHYNLEPSYYQ